MIKVHKNLYFVTSSVACSQFLALLSLFSFQGAASALFQDQIEMLRLLTKHFKLILNYFLHKAFFDYFLSRKKVVGGDNRNRTDGLLLARQALSQLSYTPIFLMVGPSGLEPPTSRLSVVRSSQLSYGPVIPNNVRPLN